MVSHVENDGKSIKCLRSLCEHRKQYYTTTKTFDLMHNVGKEFLCNMRTAKVRMGERIHAVSFGHSLLVDIHYSIH